MTPLYSIGTWDMDLQAFTPQGGLTVPCFNVPISLLRQIIRELRKMGYPSHRRKDATGEVVDSDSYVLVERTEGMTIREIMEDWTKY